jgi:endonuclease/exonuclease/phosphatase family metal-dependent hydrolase
MRRIIALASLLALFVSCHAADSKPQELRLMTYNIHWGGQDHDPVVGRNEEWIEVIKSRNPDVIVLEEANGWLPKERNLIELYVDLLNKAFPDDPPYVGYVGEATNRFHMALISRIPVAHFERFNEVDLGAETVRISVVFIHAVLDVWDEKAHVIGVHFKSRPDRPQREREARALLQILRGLPPDETVWIAGDFNSYSPLDIHPESPTPPDYSAGAQQPEDRGWEPVGYLMGEGYEDAFRTMHPVEPGYTQATAGFNERRPRHRVDFILKSPGGPWRLQMAETLADSLGHIASDHYAVFATYKWESGDASTESSSHEGRE